MDLVEPDYFLRPVPFWFSHHLTKNKQSSVSSAPSSSSKATSSSSSTTATSSSWLMQHCRYHHHLHQHHHHQIIFPLKGAAATDKPLVLHSLAQQTVNHEIHILMMMNFIYWVQSWWQWGWLLSFGRGDNTKTVNFSEKNSTGPKPPPPSFLENQNAFFSERPSLKPCIKVQNLQKNFSENSSVVVLSPVPFPLISLLRSWLFSSFLWLWE